MNVSAYMSSEVILVVLESPGTTYETRNLSFDEARSVLPRP